MGANQSTKRITVNNDSDPSLISVSDKVVKRLKKETTKKDDDDEEDEDIKRPPKYGSKVRKFVNVSDQLKQHGLPYLTTRDIQEAIDAEVQKNTEYWQERISRMKAGHERMNKVMEEEYVRATDEMEKLLPKGPSDSLPLPCQDNKKSFVSCLQNNKTQPLLCSKEVEAFTSCISNTRVKLQEDTKA